MAKQTTTSLLLSKYGDRFRKAHEQAKGEETRHPTNMGDIPVGCSGIARVTDCKIAPVGKGKDNAGKPYFYIAAAVLTPVTFRDEAGNEVMVKGKTTRITENLFDTPDTLSRRKTLEDHISYVYNILRICGIDTGDLEPEDIDNAIEQVLEDKPYIAYSVGQVTKRVKEKGEWVEKKDGRPFHQWDSVSEDFDEDSLSHAASNGSVTPATGVVDRGSPSPSSSSTSVGSKTPIPSSNHVDEFGDLDSLLAKANNDNSEAQKTLIEMAIAKGYSREEVEDDDLNWESVVEMIQGNWQREGSTDDEGSEGEDSEESSTSEEEEGSESEEVEEEEEDTTPKKGSTHKYRPIDPKTKKPMSKAVDVEVIAVNPEKETVTLKNLAKPAVKYQNVPFTKLLPT